MTDEELDQLVAQTAILTDQRLAALPLRDAAYELRDVITSVPVAANIRVDPRRLGKTRRPRILAFGAAAAAFAGAIVLAFAMIGGGSGTAWAASLVEFAESSPQLLLDGAGWEVSRADEYGTGEGEMTFAHGDREADLYWRAGSHQEWVRDRASGAAANWTVAVLRHQAQVFQYEGTTEFTALWTEGDRTIEFRAVTADIDGFVELLGALERVGVDTWLSAMPDAVIQSAERATAVKAMLADVPIPNGFDTAALENAAGIRDRYQLGADVTGAVGCAWVELWITAARTGDAAAATAALDAMATSRSWAILDEMSDQGAWPQVFWTVADGMAAGGNTEGGVPVAEFYGPALGCGK